MFDFNGYVTLYLEIKMVGSYERTASKLLSGMRKPLLIGRVNNGQFEIAHASQHRTVRARMWRTFIRMRQRVDIS